MPIINQLPVIALVFFTLITTLIIVLKLIKNTELSIIFLTLIYFTTLIYVLISMFRNIDNIINTNMLKILISLLFILILSINIAICITFSSIYNLALIRKKEASTYLVISSIIIGIFSGTIYGIILFKLLIVQSILSIMQALIISLIIFVIVPFIQSLKFNSKGSAGILQDGFLYGTMVILNPLITLQIVNNISTLCIDFSGDLLIETCTLIISFCFLLSPVVDYCLNNNVEHCKKKRNLYLEKIKNIHDRYEIRKEEECYENLRTFLTIQNMITLIMGIPYILVYLCAIYLKEYNNTTTIKTMFPIDKE